MFIPDPGSGFEIRIRGSKKSPDPGYGSATLRRSNLKFTSTVPCGTAQRLEVVLRKGLTPKDLSFMKAT
jgi:hypothetical protein